MLEVRLLEQPFVPGHLIEPFIECHGGLGGVCTFLGKVRGDSGRIEALELCYYKPLTLPAMQELGVRACELFGLMGLLIAHRVGVLSVGEPIVCVSAAAQHRRAAFDAVDWTMDHLKCASWFWKREWRTDGWHWIEPRPDDHLAIARWGG